MKRLIAEDTFYVGASDRRLALFENAYPLKDGVSYNSYLISDDKTCLLDGVDHAVIDVFKEKINEVLSGRELDYLVVQHMEPDHSCCLKDLLTIYPNATLVLTDKALQMFKDFNEDVEIKNVQIVKTGDVLDLGKHKLLFTETPMVHWPEVMMTYDNKTMTLFSADAFGSFNALNGALFAEKESFEKETEEEFRRYYTNIVGKYGPQVQMALKKLSALDIQMIAPLHGLIWKTDLDYILSLYDKWSKYEPEEKSVLVVYGSIYGHTERAAVKLAESLSDMGVKTIIKDASKTDVSHLLALAFKCSHIVIASSTYNMGLFTPIREFIAEMKAHNLQNRSFSVIENGAWAPMAGKLISDELSQLKGFTQIGDKLTIKCSLKKNEEESIQKLASLIKESF